MRLLTLILLAISGFFGSETVWACHKGGPMGFATNDPGAFSLDITLSPTFTGASTSGAAGCKDWDYSQHQQIQYLETQWSFISEAASRGQGEHLTALVQIMGCSTKNDSRFAFVLQQNYSGLFSQPKPSAELLEQLKILLIQNPLITCSS
ncbi:MAG: DUF3015 family protein [SAR324 cluster bacterium]|nr:DUF3015 family protein [SAR324 cluster bacterium]